jgi:dethiobiotin synthetase
MRTPRELFVTGTDTGVGKTCISLALLAAARRRGLRAAAMKPVETGCERCGGSLIPGDAIALAEATGLDIPVEVACPNIYETPAAPSIAARREARPFSLAAVHAARQRILALSPDLIIYEGAGGLLVPLDETLTMLHLARSLGVHDLLLVARDALGTINHTALTVSAARQGDLGPITIVLNQPAPGPTPDTSAHRTEIERLCRAPVAQCFTHRSGTTAPDLDAAPLLDHLLTHR